jgi:YD repeat-containing protein
MKKILFVLSTAIFFASCKKDSSVTPDPAPGITKKLMKSTYVYDNDPPESTTYTYDGMGRISVRADEDRTSFFDYVSANLLVVTDKKNADNSIDQVKECSINEKGYITQIIIKNSAGLQIYTVNYTYNAEGYITRQVVTGISNYEFDFTIADGNVVSSKLYYSGVLNSIREYSFDNTRLNKKQFNHSGYWSSSNLFGKVSKNVIKELKIFDTSGTLTWHTKINYEVDAGGYPVKITTDYILDGTKSVETNIYQ